MIQNTILSNEWACGCGGHCAQGHRSIVTEIEGWDSSHSWQHVMLGWVSPWLCARCHSNTRPFPRQTLRKPRNRPNSCALRNQTRLFLYRMSQSAFRGACFVPPRAIYITLDELRTRDWCIQIYLISLRRFSTWLPPLTRTRWRSRGMTQPGGYNTCGSVSGTGLYHEYFATCHVPVLWIIRHVPI